MRCCCCLSKAVALKQDLCEPHQTLKPLSLAVAAASTPSINAPRGRSRRGMTIELPVNLTVVFMTLEKTMAASYQPRLDARVFSV